MVTSLYVTSSLLRASGLQTSRYFITSQRLIRKRTTPFAMSTMSTDKKPYASASEERRWNNLSQRMSAFHEYFKYEFKEIYESADGSFTKKGLSLSMYLDTVKSFNAHLTMHHTIEERHIFPVLAKRMSKFANTEHEGHVGSHRAIHDGLEELMKHVSKWRKEPTTYSPTEMTTTLDKLRSVLFEHLDQEVEDLKGDQLRLHFTLDEIEYLSRM